MARHKKYFWNMRHHRKLEEAMGLSLPESPAMRRMREACDMPIFLATEGINPYAASGIFSYSCKPIPPGWKKLPETDTRIESELAERLKQAHN